MKSYAKRIFQTGGEGVILRAPNSFYENGKSANLQKLKVSGEKSAY